MSAQDIAALKAELANLQKLRWGGTRRLAYKGNGVERDIEMRSDSELAAAIADLERRINNRRPGTVTIRAVKGWTGTKEFEP